MFSTGQWIFVVFFIILFVIVLLYAYRKDLKLHRKYYKGSLFVLAGFLGFMLLLFLLKVFLKF